MSVEGQDERERACGHTYTHPETGMVLTCYKLVGHEGAHFVESKRPVTGEERERIARALDAVSHSSNPWDYYAAVWRAALDEAEARERVEVARAHERGYRRGCAKCLVEALEKIASDECMVDHAAGVIDAGRPQRIARSALAEVVAAEPAEDVAAKLRSLAFEIEETDGETMQVVQVDEAIRVAGER